MSSLQNLNRNLNRNLCRHHTRMLSGLHRPPPNYLAIACRALNEVLKIDKRLFPFMAEQRCREADRLRHQQIAAALDRVYGPDNKQPAQR